MPNATPLDKRTVAAFDELIATMAERDPKLFDALGGFLTFASLASHERSETAPH